MITKYIFITGGVVSSLGKGVTIASIASILESRKLKVNIIKIDPYLNVNPGTMSPNQHGEIFVTEDGSETDLDLGHYERFLNIKMNYKNNFTTGSVYKKIFKKEKKGDYLGKTIQIIPHVTEEIKKRIISVAKNNDIILVEVGGTVGDIESIPFLEAIQQIKTKIGKKNILYIHLTLLPYLSITKEIKTKPTQHSVKKLLSIGIQPDMLICRSKKNITNKEKKKISLFCNIPKKKVITLQDTNSIYNIPSLLNKQGVDKYICKYFMINTVKANLKKWKKLAKKELNTKKKINIGIIGKYIKTPDSYKSIIEALKHTGIKLKTKINIKIINSKKIKFKNKTFKKLHGILIPGGFGKKGIKGKIKATKYARKNKIPYFGICLGIQIAIIEFSKNILNIKEANSTEFKPKCKFPIIIINKNKKFKKNMRLGSKICYLNKNSLSYKLYGKKKIKERHRHRYKINKKLFNKINNKKLLIAGYSKNNNSIEIIELLNHPWFIACQFHPEFQSTPNKVHPLFIGFVNASINYKKNKEKKCQKL
ncbi:CTP synthase [Buchnera aphidicola]|uniref:CTP synthase n=1 Tax=Buchnera aphidicola TaxID=9 RepID=UPI0031B809CF